MSPPYLGMDASVWKPTSLIQPDLVVALSLASQPVPFTPQIFVQQPMSQPIQTQMNVSQPLQVVPLTQPILLIPMYT